MPAILDGVDSKNLVFSCGIIFAMAAMAHYFSAPPQEDREDAAAGRPLAAELGVPLGIVFQDCRYTVLTVKACFSHAHEPEEYNYTVRLRFHRNSPEVEISITHPDGEWTGWKTEFAETLTYEKPTAPPPDAYEAEKKAYETCPLHYIARQFIPRDGLSLHVQSLGKLARNESGNPACTVRLVESTFTQTVANGAKIFSYSFANDAVIEGANE